MTLVDEESWILLKPSMMSDEEDGEGGEILRRRPTWRSERLTSFLYELDEKASASSKTVRKKKRVLYDLSYQWDHLHQLGFLYGCSG